jgi:hypothetical protein
MPKIKKQMKEIEVLMQNAKRAQDWTVLASENEELRVQVSSLRD